MERKEAKKQNIWIPAEEISNNIDLLTEILLRLQVKPLLRFKSVSKQWLSLISNPQFSLSYTRHHHTPTILLFQDWFNPGPGYKIVTLKQDSIPEDLFFNYINVPNMIRIKQSCNGLLLCCSSDAYFTTPDNYYICNPATKQFKTLSFPSSEFKKSLVSVCLAFDHLKSIHYKLICVHEVKNKEKYQIDVYSSETDSWRLLKITLDALNVMNIPNAVYWNGAVHWFCMGETPLYFDVDRECLNTMPMPNLGSGMVEYFGESVGHLHLIVTTYPLGLQFDVLEMAADYSGWFVRYHVNLDAVRIAFPDIIWYHGGDHTFSVLHVIRAQKEEDSIVLIDVDSKAISYNIHDGTSKKICDLGTPDMPHASYIWYDTLHYFEILASV